MRQRTLLTILLAVLIIICGILIYLFLMLRTPQTVVSPEVVGVEHLFSIYGYGDKPEEQLRKPRGVATDEGGNIYITDTDHHRVLVFDGAGDFLFKFGKQGPKKGGLYYPLGITVSSKGNIYVCDKRQSKIVMYNSKGKVTKEIVEMMPLVPAAKGKKLYVATYGHVVVYGLDGNLISKWGRRGRSSGQFDFPGGIAVGKKGIVYLSDSNNNRVQALDKNGEVLWIYGRPPKSMSDPDVAFGLPEGLAVDDEGKIFVVDAFHHTVQIFNSKGKKLAEVGEMGGAEGRFYYPAGIVYLGGRKFAIADTYNNRVQVVRLSVPRKETKKKK